MFALVQIVALCAAADAALEFTIPDAALMTPARVIHIRLDGPESVLDAVAKLPPASLARLARMDMWIVRRTADDKIQVLTIDWAAISQRGATATNYQLFDGDRLYLQARPGFLQLEK